MQDIDLFVRVRRCRTGGVNDFVFRAKGIVLKSRNVKKNSRTEQKTDKPNEMKLVWLRCTDVGAINHTLCSKPETFYIAH